MLARVLVGLAILGGSGVAAEIHVPGDRPSIQSALRAAAAGDVILVGPGIYAESLVFQGRDVHLRSTHGPEHTVLDLSATWTVGADGSVVRFDKGEGPGAILEGFRITGGRGTACDPLRPDQFFGGGILCLHGSSPTIRGNLIDGNRADHDLTGGIGAGMYVGPGCAPVIEENCFQGNITDSYYGGHGGGLAAESATLWLRANRFESNLAQSGGGLYSDHCDGLVESNEFCDNFTYWGGGGAGAYLTGQRSPEFRQNLFEQNTALDFEFTGGRALGGGLCCDGCTLLRMDRDRFTDNECLGEGGGLYVECQELQLDGLIVTGNRAHHSFTVNGAGAWISSDSGWLRHLTVVDNIATDSSGIARTAGVQLIKPLPLLECVLWQNLGNGQPRSLQGAGLVRYSLVEGGWHGKGNLDQAPQLDSHYRLLLDSPCIDRGDPEEQGVREDAFGMPRTLDGDLDGEIRADMGAAEFGHVELEYAWESVLPLTYGGSSAVELTLTAKGTDRMPAALLISTAAATLPHVRYGPFYVDLRELLLFTPLGFLPAQRTFDLSNAPPSLTTLYFQAIAFSAPAKAGNTSNRLEVTLRH